MFSGLSLRAGGQGFSPATSGPRLLLLENRRKIEPQEMPSRLIPHLLVVFTWQLEILVTTLVFVKFVCFDGAIIHFYSLVVYLLITWLSIN